MNVSDSSPILQVRFRPQAEWDGLELRAHAEELAADAHDGETRYVQQPPADRRREVTVVDPTDHQVYQVSCTGEVETLLRALDQEPEPTRSAGKGKQTIYV